MSSRVVYLIDQDISDKIISIPDIVTSAGDFGQLTINELPNLVGDNLDRFWDQTNQASPFFGARELSTYDIQIYTDGQLTYEGVIESIQASNQAKTATVTLKSGIQRALEKGLVYRSTANSNPSKMVQEICSLYKIPIDGSSFGRASAIYDLDLVYTSAAFLNVGTVQDGIQQILEAGIGRIYLQGNRLYYDVFQVRDTVPIFTASDQHIDGITLFSHPEITTVEKEPILGYNIQFVGGLGGSAASFGSEQEQGKSIDGSNNSPVRIMTLQAATWIGERWMDYFGTKQEMVKFIIPARYGKSLSINDTIEIKYRGSTYNINIISINNSLRIGSEMVGITE